MQEGTVKHHRGSGWVAIAAGCLIAAPWAFANDDSPPKADPPKDRTATKLDKGAPKKSPKAKPADLPQRPERKVVPPTITSPQLDALIAARLAKVNPDVTPAPATNDLEFVRRVYLDLGGVPPTPGQVREFVESRGVDKRARLIDELLASPEYARNWSRYWREVVQFRASNANVQQVRFDVLETWLAEQFERNRPWDEIAAGLIRGSGPTDENGAANFNAAHAGSAVQTAGEASRVFLGVQIQCAECHDHKSDSWKREQFHEFAAFFAGERMQRTVKPEPGVKARFSVLETPRARYTMPDLADPAKSIPVKPRFFLASSVAGPSETIADGLSVAQLRELAASYITGQDNPWFARAYVNRIWTVLMGEGFYELIDDIGPERELKGEEILFPLADQWREGGYDVRWLFRTILNTKAYQRRAKSTASPAGMTQLAAVCPSRLRADQIFEALTVALDLPAEGLSSPDGSPRKADGKALKPTKTAGKPNQVQKAVEAAGLGGAVDKRANRVPSLRVPFDKLFGVDPSTLPDEVLGSIPQALFLMNGPLVHNRTQARPGTPLGAILSRTDNDRDAVDSLYMLVLSRIPTSKESEVCRAYITRSSNRKEAFEDVYWSLVNSTEFLSRR